MYVKCPEGWSAKRQQKFKDVTITVEATEVQIYGGICDSADLCGRTSCRFYDLSPEATRLFMRAMGEEETLDGLLRALRPH